MLDLSLSGRISWLAKNGVSFYPVLSKVYLWRISLWKHKNLLSSFFVARNTYQSHICLALRKTSTHATCLSSEPSQALLILVEKLVILPWPRAHAPTYIIATLILRVCNHMLSTPNIYSMAKVYSLIENLSKRSMAISKKIKKRERRKDLCFLCLKNEKRGSHL